MKQKFNVGVAPLGDQNQKSHIALHTSQKGITLIALVITIIVLLILAGVTISMVLGDNGIIGQAQHAKQQQEKADAKEKGEINSLDWRIPVAAGTHETVSSEKEGVPIPKGFYYVGGTKETGLIISDSANDKDEGESKTNLLGNQFVWVPVDNSTLPMFTYDDTSKNYTGKLYEWNSWTGTGNPSEMYENYKEPQIAPNNGAITNGILTEYNSMAKSVEIYEGFYVGRYETGGFNSTKVVSKAGESQASCTNQTWYTMYSKQKELYGANSSVTSGMIYGSQWDAIMKWMKDEKNTTDSNKYYIKDSTGMGHYCYDENCEPITDNIVPIATGSNNNYKVKNIYDLAGNYYEWTQEANDTDFRVDRGGYYDSNGSGGSASDRLSIDPTGADDYYSSRLQLYIK